MALKQSIALRSSLIAFCVWLAIISLLHGSKRLEPTLSDGLESSGHISQQSSSLPISDGLGRVVILVVVIAGVSGPQAIAVEQKTADYPIRPWARQLNLLGGNHEHGDASPSATLQRELSEEGFQELADLTQLLKPWRAWRVNADASVMPSRQAYAFDAIEFWVKVSEKDARAWFGLGREGKLRVIPLHDFSHWQKVDTASKEQASCFLWGYGKIVRHTLENLNVGEKPIENIEPHVFTDCKGARATLLDNVDVVSKRWTMNAR